jgi:hypothetical protein
LFAEAQLSDNLFLSLVFLRVPAGLCIGYCTRGTETAVLDEYCLNRKSGEGGGEGNSGLRFEVWGWRLELERQRKANGNRI